MASGYKHNGTDLDDLFEPYVSGTKAPVTGIKVAGVDINNRYTRLQDGLQGPDVNYSSAGVNLADIFAANTATFTIATKITNTRTTSWTNTIQHIFTVSFSSSSAASEFFRLSGQIRFSGARYGGSANSQNTDWTGLLSGAGTVMFEKTQTTQTGTIGTPTLVGYDDLTSTYQEIFNVYGSGVYSGDRIRIRARADSTTVLRFEVTYYDANDGTIDQSVDGTITSVISERKHSSLSSPTYTTTTSLSSGT